jgi:ferredoxin
MKVTLDATRCQGHGRCYEIAERVFTADDWGHSELLRPEVSGQDAELAAEAARACPETAVAVEG